MSNAFSFASQMSCRKYGNIRMVKTDKKKEDTKQIHFTLFDCPYIQLEVLILEDRVQYNVMNLINNILPKSIYWKNDKVRTLCDALYQDKKNPVKRGLVGKYNYILHQNLTDEETMAFSDVIDVYDEATRFPERVLKAKIKDFAATKIDHDLDLFAEVCFCEILASYTCEFHRELNEKVPNVDRYIRNMKWNGEIFYMIESALDQIARIITDNNPVDFTESEAFRKAYNTYCSTINNDTRVKAEYDKIGKRRDAFITDPKNNVDILNNNFFPKIKIV